MIKTPNTPHDPQERLILAIQQVADDIIHLMTVPPHRVPTTDPAGQQIIGMFLVLGRLYWAITGTTFQTKDPKKILQWARSLKKKEIIVL